MKVPWPSPAVRVTAREPRFSQGTYSQAWRLSPLRHIIAAPRRPPSPKTPRIIQYMSARRLRTGPQHERREPGHSGLPPPSALSQSYSAAGASAAFVASAAAVSAASLAASAAAWASAFFAYSAARFAFSAALASFAALRAASCSAAFAALAALAAFAASRRAAGLERVAAGAANGALHVLRMNTLLHGRTPLVGLVSDQTRGYGPDCIQGSQVKHSTLFRA